jgi:hypothetical protein
MIEERSEFSEFLTYACINLDLAKKNKTIRFFNLHLLRSDGK